MGKDERVRRRKNRTGSEASEPGAIPAHANDVI